MDKTWKPVSHSLVCSDFLENMTSKGQNKNGHWPSNNSCTIDNCNTTITIWFMIHNSFMNWKKNSFFKYKIYHGWYLDTNVHQIKLFEPVASEWRWKLFWKPFSSSHLLTDWILVISCGSIRFLIFLRWQTWSPIRGCQNPNFLEKN